mmetsp:Transcript_29747/g.84849  ORF Transcript_29747/g.84849 Transcript_29747/m.84849 type:complete len:322 (+) Transcript_29747:967-1932(+)
MCTTTLRNSKSLLGGWAEEEASSSSGESRPPRLPGLGGESFLRSPGESPPTPGEEAFRFGGGRCSTTRSCNGKTTRYGNRQQRPNLSTYLKRLRCNVRTEGNWYIRNRFSASCRQAQVSQKNLLFARNRSVDSKARRHAAMDVCCSMSTERSKKVSLRTVTLSQHKHLVWLTKYPCKMSCTHVFGPSSSPSSAPSELALSAFDGVACPLANASCRCRSLRRFAIFLACSMISLSKNWKNSCASWCSELQKRSLALRNLAKKRRGVRQPTFFFWPSIWANNSDKLASNEPPPGSSSRSSARCCRALRRNGVQKYKACKTLFT